MTTKNIRNICLLGHGGSGKTTLAENMLYMTGAIDRMGKCADGNTVCDFDAEEIKRQISISTSVAPVEHNGHKLNILDTPGSFDFSGAVMEAMCAADGAVIVCSAKDGVTVGAEKSWKYCEERGLARFIYISRLDEENSSFATAFSALRERFGNKVVPLVIPIVDGSGKVTGVVDILNKRAYEMKNLKRNEVPVPADMNDAIAEYTDELKEAVAETSEELMEKFFDGQDFTPAEMLQGLRDGVRNVDVVPVVCGSAIGGLGTLMLMDNIISLMPDPTEGAPLKAEGESFAVSENGPAAAFVFKTVSDQYGKYSFVKVLSGTINSDAPLVNSRTGDSEKLGRLYRMRGKKADEVKELICGDIGAIGKMDRVKTGDTLCDSRKVVALDRVPYAEPCYSLAVASKAKGQEDKVAAGLTRLNEEDPSFTLENNPETKQMVVSGTGDMQLDVLCSKLKTRFNVEAVLKPARVPYRETIKKKVEAHGRHKKQTGGSGQFGDVWIRFEPQYDSDEMVFAEEVFGGSVPKNFFPAVEKGLREAVNRGVLAGYPVVNLKATLYDGSYHPVDSNEAAFKTAAQLAYKEGMPNAQPVILEPIGSLAVTVPSDYMGDIIGDLNKRRGRVMGMNPASDGSTVIEAEVPMAEMSSYTIDLRSMTQGRGSFVFRFERYEEAPGNVQQKVIEEAKALAEAE